MFKRLANPFIRFYYFVLNFFISCFKRAATLNVKMLTFFTKVFLRLQSKGPHLTLANRLEEAFINQDLDDVGKGDDYHNHPVVQAMLNRAKNKTKSLQENGSVGLIRALGRPVTYKAKLDKELDNLNKDASAAVISKRFEDTPPFTSDELNTLMASKPLSKEHFENKISEILTKITENHSQHKLEMKNKYEDLNKSELTQDVVIEVDDSDFYPPLKPHLTGDVEDTHYKNRKAEKASTKAKIIKKKTSKKPVKKSSKNKKK